MGGAGGVDAPMGGSGRGGAHGSPESSFSLAWPPRSNSCVADAVLGTVKLCGEQWPPLALQGSLMGSECSLGVGKPLWRPAHSAVCWRPRERKRPGVASSSALGAGGAQGTSQSPWKASVTLW